MTVSVFSDEFIAVYAKVENKESEVETEKRLLRVHLIPFFGHRRLDDIGPELIAKHKAEKLKAEYDPKTINSHIGVLR
jgi:hypothetical protein